MYLCYIYFNSSRNVEIYFYEKEESEYQDFASFATYRISTLTKISGHLKGIFSDKISQYYKFYVYFNLFVYKRFQLTTCNWNTWAAILFSGHPYIESTTVLSDNHINIHFVFHFLFYVWLSKHTINRKWVLQIIHNHINVHFVSHFLLCVMLVTNTLVGEYYKLYIIISIFILFLICSPVIKRHH